MNVKPFAVLLVVLSTFALAPASASSASVGVSMDKATYSVVDTLALGAAPVATVTILDAEGAPVAGAAVSVAFLRTLPGVGFVASEIVTGTTGQDGTLSVSAPQASCAPGNYLVIASALEQMASVAYSVGA